MGTVSKRIRNSIPMHTIGLTGGLGTGKSTVSHYFKDCGAIIINADKLVHQELEENGRCYKAIVKIFGEAILTGRYIDRKKLAEIVFNNPKKLKKLESIIHPAVKKRFIKKLSTWNKNSIVIFEVPLLFESKFDRLVDLTVVVKTNREKQVQRILKNGRLTKSQALLRISAQMPIREKVRRADYTIDNSRTLIHTKKQVEKLWQKIQQEIKK